MPLVRISLREGTSPQYRQALADGVHQAMVEAIEIPGSGPLSDYYGASGEWLDLRSVLPGNRAQRQDRARADHFIRRTQAGAEEETVPTHGGNHGEESGTAPAGSVRQPSGSRLGELVVRKRGSAVQQIVERKAYSARLATIWPESTGGSAGPAKLGRGASGLSTGTMSCVSRHSL